MKQVNKTVPPRRLAMALVALTALAACEDGPLDFDMRGRMGGSVDTSAAALGAVAPRPQPDDRGVISYPNYQVAVARRGDTVASLSQRIGADAAAVARYNGLMPEDSLRFGEVVALPARVAEPTGGPIQPPEDITAIAGAALDAVQAPAVETSSLSPAPAAAPRSQTGVEPTRHQVKRGETAYTIARLYGVSVRSLADWNGLGSDFALREGQYLLIPVVLPDETPQADSAAAVTAPGQGSPTPVPPSASAPLPDEAPVAASAPIQAPPAPDIGEQSAPTTQAAMSLPVTGSIIREYSQGKNDGLDIAVAAGTPVKAATDGTVGAITKDSTTGSSIVVLKHSDGLLTVYMNVTDIKVAKNDQVSRGEAIASAAGGSPSYVRFGVYQGNKAVDPAPYLAP